MRIRKSPAEIDINCNECKKSYSGVPAAYHLGRINKNLAIMQCPRCGNYTGLITNSVTHRVEDLFGGDIKYH